MGTTQNKQQEYQSMNCVLDADKNGKGALWVGDISSARDLQMLKKNNIHAILSCALGSNLNYPQNEFKHLVLDIVDFSSFDIYIYFESANLWIEEHREDYNILIHCMAGISRSASIAIAYFIRKFNQDYKTIIGNFKQKRPVIQPNHGFVRQLKEYEQELQDKPRDTLQSYLILFKKNQKQKAEEYKQQELIKQKELEKQKFKEKKQNQKQKQKQQQQNQIQNSDQQKEQ